MMLKIKLKSGLKTHKEYGMFRAITSNDDNPNPYKRMLCPLLLKNSYWVNMMVNFIPDELHGQQKIYCIDYFDTKKEIIGKKLRASSWFAKKFGLYKKRSRGIQSHESDVDLIDISSLLSFLSRKKILRSLKLEPDAVEIEMNSLLDINLVKGDILCSN